MEIDPTSLPRYAPGGPIVLAEHDQAWAVDFDHEADAIRSALGDLEIAVHHIGSTSVAGLAAKPVIDILVVVSDLAALDAHGNRLTLLGYEARGEFGVSGRRFYQKTMPNGVRTHQIHAYAASDAAIQAHLDFRDYLRAHPATADAYARLKAQLAELCGSDIEAYAVGKTAFVRDVERRAALWRARG